MSGESRLRAALARWRPKPKPAPPDPRRNDDAYPGTTEWAQWVEARITRLETRQRIYLALLAATVLERVTGLIDVLR